jgi:hypothetical protein
MRLSGARIGLSTPRVHMSCELPCQLQPGSWRDAHSLHASDSGGQYLGTCPAALVVSKLTVRRHNRHNPHALPWRQAVRRDQARLHARTAGAHGREHDAVSARHFGGLVQHDCAGVVVPVSCNRVERRIEAEAMLTCLGMNWTLGMAQGTAWGRIWACTNVSCMTV